MKVARRWLFSLRGAIERLEKPIHHPALHTDTHCHEVTEGPRSRTDSFFPLVWLFVRPVCKTSPPSRREAFVAQVYLTGDDMELGCVTQHEPSAAATPAWLLKTHVELVTQLTVQTARAMNNVNCLQPLARVGGDASDG